MLVSNIQKTNVISLSHFGLTLAIQRNNEMYKT